jgi:hypothetical protein
MYFFPSFFPCLVLGIWGTTGGKCFHFVSHLLANIQRRKADTSRLYAKVSWYRDVDPPTSVDIMH